MNGKLGFLLLSSILSVLVVSCGGAAATAPPATEASGPQICSGTLDGLGQSYTGRPVGATYLGAAHGKFVYSDLLNEINNAGQFSNMFIVSDQFQGETNFSTPEVASAEITNLVVILVVDTFADSSSDQDNTNANVNTFVKRMDLYLSNSNSSQAILVVAVDTNGLSFNHISTNIPAAVEYFSNNSIQIDKFSLPTANQFVVNMSFVFVPCQPMSYISTLLSEYNSNYELNLSPNELENLNALSQNYDNHEGNFYRYLNCLDFDPADCLQVPINLRDKLQNLNENYEKIQTSLDGQPITVTETFSDAQIDDAVFNAFIIDLVYLSSDKTWADALAPLQDQLASYSNVVFVGAAGNFGHPNPLMPASWSFVYGISSEPSQQSLPPSHAEVQSVNNGLTLAKYSNWGEVQLDGDFWAVPDAIYGTSFAAPKFSARIAQHLLLGTGCPQALNSASSLPTDTWDNDLYNCTP